MSTAKTRLNVLMRQQLRRLAETSVKDTPVEEKAYVAAHAAATKEVIRCARAKWPDKDMAVLRKYSLGHFRMEVLIIMDTTAPDSCGRQVMFNTVLKPLPYEEWDNIRRGRDPKRGFWSPHSGNALALDKKATEVMDQFLSIEAARAKRIESTKNDLRLLIQEAKFLETIEEVWPAAKAVRPKGTANLPTVPLSDVMARIREAVANKNL